MITVEQLSRAVRCNLMTASNWHLPLVRAMKKWEIDNPQRIAGWLAQMAHESGHFTVFEENLNYGAAGLAKTWPRRFAVNPYGQIKIANEFAEQLARHPEAIANSVYANRMGNGGEQSGDGWKFRGRGPKQITGKDNYRACGNALGLDLLTRPELLLEREYGADSAGWYWASHNCNRLMDAGDFRGCTYAINGGYVGEDDREANYEQARQVLC